ncbi:MAG: hypothetical protein IJX51_07175 [Clostridia bacterium]|nr:hypothetical protein [Clostridia bacterium]
MKNNSFYYKLAFDGFKALYILLILASLFTLCLALCRGEVGYAYVTENHLRPLCDDILLGNLMLTGAFVLFSRFF